MILGRPRAGQRRGLRPADAGEKRCRRRASFGAWIAAAIAAELRIRRDMRQLRAMDDCMLEDIGLTRTDIGAAVRYGRN